MRKKNRILWIGAFCMCAAAMLNAQTVSSKFEKRVGLGVAIGKEVLYTQESGLIDQPINQVDFPTFYIPVLFIPHLRFEAEFGYMRYATSSILNESQQTLTLYGAGAFFTQWYGSVDLYFGGRINWLKTSYHYKNSQQEYTHSRIDRILGPAVGGEYFFTNHLSLGGEIQFNFITIGKVKGLSPIEEIAIQVDNSVIQTKPLIFVRWYFGNKD